MVDDPPHDALECGAKHHRHDEELEGGAPHGLSLAHEAYLEWKQQYGYRRGTGAVDPIGDVELVEEDGVVGVDDAEERIHRKAVGNLHPVSHDAEEEEVHDDATPEGPGLRFVVTGLVFLGEREPREEPLGLAPQRRCLLVELASVIGAGQLDRRHDERVLMGDGRTLQSQA